MDKFTLYIVRHGETVWNSKGITQGRRNTNLTALGKSQAESTALALKDTHIDLIITSPLMRAVQTANILNSVIKTKIIKDERIIELDQGIYTAKKRSSLTIEEQKRAKLRLKEDGMESYPEAFVRVRAFLSDAITTYKGKTIIIVTHRGIAALAEYALKFEAFDFESFANVIPFENAEARKYELWL